MHELAYIEYTLVHQAVNLSTDLERDCLGSPSSQTSTLLSSASLLSYFHWFTCHYMLTEARSRGD